MYMEMSKSSSSIAARALKSSSLVSEPTAAAFMVNPCVGQDLFFLSSADAAGDDFSVDVDEFFDLHGSEEDEEGGAEAQDKTSSSSSSSSSSWSSSSSLLVDEGTSFSPAASDFFPAADGLPIPADEINKELELWSRLMDGALHDDFSTCPTRNPYATTPVPNQVRFEPKVKPALVADATRFAPPPFTRPRSKRSRPITGASWSSCSLLEPESSLSSSVSSSPEPGPGKTGVKRMNRSPVEDDGDSVSTDGPAQLRKCTHCQVEKTPQWRTGPLGPKTLCNACGVRFKSGRLFPEYRPACSPTFSSEVHSNSHRKVVEMRKKRKIAEPGLAPSILSC